MGRSAPIFDYSREGWERVGFELIRRFLVSFLESFLVSFLESFDGRMQRERSGS